MRRWSAEGASRSTTSWPTMLAYLWPRWKRMLQQLELIRKPHWTSKNQRPGQVIYSIIIFSSSFLTLLWYLAEKHPSDWQLEWNIIPFFKVRPTLLPNLPLVLLVFQLATSIPFSSPSAGASRCTLAICNFGHVGELEIHFETQVCQCLKCVNLFKEAGIAFLTDETDTVHHYEEKVCFC